MNMKIGDLKLRDLGVGGIVGGAVKGTFAETLDAVRARLNDKQTAFIVSAGLDSALFHVKSEVLSSGDKFESREATNRDGDGGYVDGAFYTYRGALAALDKIAEVDARSLSPAQHDDLAKLFVTLLAEDPSQQAIGFVNVGKAFGL
jgi:hypothetical protein